MSGSNRGEKSGIRRLTKAGPSKPSPNTDSTPTTDSGKTEIDGSPKISPTLPANNELNTEPKAGEKAYDRRNRPNPRCEIKTLFEALLVLVGIATCGVMVWQNLLTGQAIDKSNEANEIAQKAIFLSQRAWLAPNSISISDDIKSANSVKIEVIYKNVGKDPAREIWQKLSYLVSQNQIPQPNNPTICKNTQPSPGASLVAYPSESIDYRSTLTINELDGIKTAPKEFFNSATVIYLQGCLTYLTLGERHESLFCFAINPMKDKPYGMWPWNFCQTGNDGN